MRVAFFASEIHYAEHLEPIWQAMGRLGFFSRGEAPPTDALTVVASIKDLRRSKATKAVLVEHGAGQSFSSHHGAHPGGVGREKVALFICPNEAVAERNRARYPDAAYAVVGCPKLDAIHQGPMPTGKAIAFSFHWDGSLAPEARSAFKHYVMALPGIFAALKAEGHEVIGHAHPRALARLEPFYAAAGVEVVPRFADVLDRAGLYVCDGVSTLYEFASTDRPVVVLNAPWYRRSVEHGLRYWEFADVGIQVDEPAALLGCIELALVDPEPIAKRRRFIVEKVYGSCDGLASERAADAIRALLT